MYRRVNRLELLSAEGILFGILTVFDFQGGTNIDCPDAIMDLMDVKLDEFGDAETRLAGF